MLSLEKTKKVQIIAKRLHRRLPLKKRRQGTRRNLTPTKKYTQTCLQGDESDDDVHVEALDYLIQCKANERKVAVAKLSLLFPIRDRKLHVFHKSVKDWLVDLERKDETER